MTNVIKLEDHRPHKFIFAIRESRNILSVIKLNVPVTVTVERIHHPDDKLLIDADTKKIIWAASDRQYMLGEAFHNIEYLYASVNEIERFPVRG